LKISNFRSRFQSWFKSRFGKLEDEHRLSNFVDHLDQLSVLLDLDIYSIGIDNLRRLRLLSDDVFKECQGLQAENNRIHMYALKKLIYYKIYENRPRLFKDYSDLLNGVTKRLTVGSAFTYTTEAQLMAEKFSKTVFKKDLNAAIQEEEDFVELLKPYIWNRKKSETFKGISHFYKFLKSIK